MTLSSSHCTNIQDDQASGKRHYYVFLLEAVRIQHTLGVARACAAWETSGLQTQLSSFAPPGSLYPLRRGSDDNRRSGGSDEYLLGEAM